jgi:hypothetical protein
LARTRYIQGYPTIDHGNLTGLSDDDHPQYLQDAPVDGEEYVRKDGDWEIASAGGGGASELSDLSDVGVSTPTDQNVLVADGDSWESRALVEADISDLGTYLTSETSHADVVVDGDIGVTVAAESHEHTESDITDLGTYLEDKADVEGVLTGEISSHTHAAVAADIPMIILTKSSSVNQNVGGANGTEVWWTWDAETIKDTGFTFTATDTEVTVDADGWYEITFIGAAQTTGSARTTLQGIHRINGGATSRAGGLRNYTRGANYGNVTTGLIYTVELSEDDVIEVGTRVEDTDSSYTINTSGGEIADECHQLVIKKIR